MFKQCLDQCIQERNFKDKPIGRGTKKRYETIKKIQAFLNETSKPCADRWSMFAYHNIATIRAEKEAKIAAENSGSGSWKDGTYEGSGQGFGGQIVVSVTIKNGSIDDIQIKEAKNEDSAYFDNAKKIIDTMKQKQTADVDVASGATYSSKGIIAAVQNALKEAS